MTTPATETKSIGLLADAQLSWFLQRHLDSFIMTGHLLPVYRDYAIWTTSSWHENSRPFTGTLQKRMPTLTRTATAHTTGPLGVIASAKPDPVHIREFTMTRIFRPLIGTPPSTNSCFDMTGLLQCTLQIIIHGFVFINLQNRLMSTICKFACA